MTNGSLVPTHARFKEAEPISGRFSFFAGEVCSTSSRRIKIASLGTGHVQPGLAKAKGRGIMDMRTLLLATRPQRQGLLQEGAMAMAMTHEQAINQSWDQLRESTAQPQ